MCMQKQIKQTKVSSLMNSQLYIYDELEKMLNEKRRYTQLLDGLGLSVRRDASQVISPRQDKVFVTKVDTFSTSFTGQFKNLEEAYAQAKQVLNHGVILQTANTGIFCEETPLSKIEKLARNAHIAVQKPPMPKGVASQLYRSILQTE